MISHETEQPAPHADHSPDREPIRAAVSSSSELVKLLVAAADQEERILDALAAALLQDEDGRQVAITLATELVGAASQTPISQTVDARFVRLNHKPNTNSKDN